jgi:outer membrane lipoprotein-sorting protein
LEELRRDPEVEKPIILTVLAMSGVIGIETVATQEEVVLLEVEDQYLLEVNEPDHGNSAVMSPRRRIWFDRQTLYVVKEERMGHSGSVDASLQLDDFREAVPTIFIAEENNETGKLMMPFHLIAQDSTGEGEITVKFTELRPNVPVTDTDFSLTHSSMAR